MSFDNLEQPKSMFDLEMDYEELLEIPAEYVQIRLSEMEDGEIFTGKPQISSILTNEYDDGFDINGKPQRKTVHKLRMIITNKEDEEYLDVNINLKQNSYKVDTIRKGSVLFDFVQSILELENEGRTANKNIFKNVNLKQFTDFVNGLQVMSVKNVERAFNGRAFNSFYVIRVNNKSNEKLE